MQEYFKWMTDNGTEHWYLLPIERHASMLGFIYTQKVISMDWFAEPKSGVWAASEYDDIFEKLNDDNKRTMIRMFFNITANSF